MEKTGILRKMNVEFDDTIKYWMNLDKESTLYLNDVLGGELLLEWTNEIHCINCDKPINKTFGQGFCYTCFTEAAQASPCIMRPELCEAHLGKGRDVEWEQRNHNQPHVVYLAQTNGVKVGVTRATQVPTRWIDQGAWRAIPVARTPNRYLAGIIEVEFKQFLSDRTDWRKMLIDARGDDDLKTVADEVIGFLPEHLQKYTSPTEKVLELNYPVQSYPKKVSTLKLEDGPIQKKLTGIRGQYLYFDENEVINLRKYSGYKVKIEA